MNIAIAALARTLTCYRRELTVSAYNETTGTTETAFTVRGHAYPTSARERLLLPEGLRARATWSLVTEDALQVGGEATGAVDGALSDIVVVDGIRYEAVSVSDRSTNPIVGIRHRTYTLAQENPA